MPIGAEAPTIQNTYAQVVATPPPCTRRVAAIPHRPAWWEVSAGIYLACVVVGSRGTEGHVVLVR